MGGASYSQVLALLVDSAGNLYAGGEFRTAGGKASSYIAHWIGGAVVAVIERPIVGAWVTGTVTLSGFAIDLGSPTSTGIDRVHIYLDGPYGTGTIIGGATYGLDRPDVAAQYGARFAPSGWELAWNTSGVPFGVHRTHPLRSSRHRQCLDDDATAPSGRTRRSCDLFPAGQEKPVATWITIVSRQGNKDQAD